MKNWKLKFTLKLVLFSSFIISISSSLDSKTNDPGEGGGGGFEIGANSKVVRNGTYVNTLTGLPNYSMDISKIYDKVGYHCNLSLFYNMPSLTEATTNNNVAPTSYVGLGWTLQFSYIYSVHQNTTTRADDRNYWVSSDGVVSEIVKTSDGKFRIKAHPFWDVRRDEFKIPLGKDTVIDIQNWMITKENGELFTYGFTHQCEAYGDSIAPHRQKSSTTPTIIFNYRWDLRDATGGNLFYGFTIGYDIKHEYINGHLFTREAPVKIIYDWSNGDSIKFTYKAKRNEELPQNIPAKTFYSYEKYYLSALTYKNKKGIVIDSVSFIYSNEPNQPGGINNGRIGYEKRLLLGIKSINGTGAINRFFYYDLGHTYTGYLTRIEEPTSGLSIRYNYDDKNIYNREGDSVLGYRLPVVNKLEVYDGAHQEQLVTNFTYSDNPLNQAYIKETGIAYWGDVRQNGGNGDIQTISDVNPKSHLFGTPKQIFAYNKAGTEVNSKKYSISKVTFKPFSPDTAEWILPYIAKTEIKQDNITNMSGIPSCYYNVVNGGANVSYIINSDGKGLLTETVFAFEKYPRMSKGDKCWNVTQVAGTKIIEVPNYDRGCEYKHGLVQKATFTTWKPFYPDSNYLWMPHKTYAWKATRPIVDSLFPEFDLNNPTANGWELTSSVDYYNRLGSVLQSSDPSGISSANIYRSDYNLIMALIKNAFVTECAAYTCDYDAADTVASRYLDSLNGWERCNSILTNRSHFGTHTIYVNLPSGSNRFGPSRNVQICQTKDYILSAWVYVDSGTFTINGDYRKVLNNWDVHNVASMKMSALIKGFGIGKTLTAKKEWQLVELYIPASKDISAQEWINQKWGIRFYIGGPSGAKAYISDIRFYPSDALMSTNYYEPMRRKLQLSVNPKNNPSKYTKYDTYGRESEIYKINKTGSIFDTSAKRILAYEYGRMGDKFRLIYPNGGEIFIGKINYNLRWTPGNNSTPVGIKFYDGNTWIDVVKNITGDSYAWTVPDTVKNNCRIMVYKMSNPTFADTTDGFFSVQTNRAPEKPILIYPINDTLIRQATINFQWKPSIDPDSNMVSYKLEIKRNKGQWFTIASNLTTTNHTFTFNTGDYGIYNWRITAADGTFGTAETGSFIYVSSDVFLLWTITNKIAWIIPNHLYHAIYATLTPENKIKFAATYNDSLTSPENRIFTNRGYFEILLDDGKSFKYRLFHTKTAWIGGYMGYELGVNDIGGGGGCALNGIEMRTIVLESPVDVSAPGIKFKYEYSCGSDGPGEVGYYGWDQEIYPDNRHDEGIMGFLWTCNDSKYHTWYRAWRRGASWTGWYTDGGKVAGGRLIDKIQLFMFRYDK